MSFEDGQVLSTLAHTIEGQETKLKTLHTVSRLIYKGLLIFLAETIWPLNLANIIVSFLHDYRCEFLNLGLLTLKNGGAIWTNKML